MNRFRQQLKDNVDRSCDKIIVEINSTQSECVSEIKNAIANTEKETKITQELAAAIGSEIREGGLKLIQYKPKNLRSQLSQFRNFRKTLYLTLISKIQKN